MDIGIVENYEDVIIVYEEDREAVEKAGLTFNEDGECYLSMKFEDGIARMTDDTKLEMTYPTIEEVKKSEQMQDAIMSYTGRDDIIPYDIALRFGKLKFIG
jgi:hypothetical protein